jgi:hypothetical protein
MKVELFSVALDFFCHSFNWPAEWTEKKRRGRERKVKIASLTCPFVSVEWAATVDK